MKENENLLKTLMNGFLFIYLFIFIFMGRVGLNLGILFLG